jgi:cytochrome c-type biogenesis protein CcmH
VIGRLRAWLPWAGLLAVLAVSLAVVVARGDDPGPQDRVEALARGLRCPTCQNESVAESRSATADAIRADIARRVEAGESDATIERAYVDRYGEWILLTPPDRGVGLVVWGLPVAVLVVGAAGLAAAVRRGAAARRTATPDDEELVGGLRGEPPG